MTHAALQTAKAWLATLAPRERRSLLLGAVLVCLALTWSVLVAPAWRTLRDAPAQQAKVLPQLQRMRALAAEARALQTRGNTALLRTEREQALAEVSQRYVGSVDRAQIQGDRALVTLHHMPAQDLANWLEEVRINARLMPTEAQLARASGSSKDKASGDVLWSGTVVFALAGLNTP